MKKSSLIIGGTVIAIVLIIMGLSKVAEEQPLGSVSTASEYKYVHYSGSGIASTTLLKTGSGTFGSVIITEDQAGAVILYDATSTAAIGTGFETAIATFESAQLEGVYTFDVSFYNGLVFSGAGETFAGNWTITYR